MKLSLLALCLSLAACSPLVDSAEGGDGGTCEPPDLGPCPPPSDACSACSSCDPMFDPLCILPSQPCSAPGLAGGDCAAGDWCSACDDCAAGECRTRGALHDPCALGRDDSCIDGLYCSFASGECEELPRTDCTP